VYDVCVRTQAHSLRAQPLDHNQECQQCESAVISQPLESSRHHAAANGNSLPARNVDATATATVAVVCCK